MKTKYFVYDVPHVCEYVVSSYGLSDPSTPCGKPAPYLGYSVSEDGSIVDKQYLCAAHLTTCRICAIFREQSQQIEKGEEDATSDRDVENICRLAYDLPAGFEELYQRLMHRSDGQG